MKRITIIHPTTKAPFHVVFGRKRPVAEGSHMRLSHYLKQTLSSPPTSVSYWTPPCEVALRDIYANDELGDCVVASRYHGVATATGNAGDLFHASKDAIVKVYSAIGGYVPGQPDTDQGLDEVTAQNYWMKNGFLNGTKPLGYVAVDASNWVEVQTAIWLFEGADICMELPDVWVTPSFPSGDGFTWDVGTPDQNNGHCIQATGYGPSGVEIDTWGLKGTLTKAALAELAVASTFGSFYVVLTPDLVAKGSTKAPSGVAWNDLVADFNAFGGNVPVPAPAPPPPPAPGVPITLAQAQAAVRSGIAAGSPFQSRGMAEGLAVNALAAVWPKP